MKQIRMQALHPLLWMMFAAIVMAGWWYPALGWLALLCMFAPPLVAFFRGRTWCGHFCPMGTLASWASRAQHGPVLVAGCRQCGLCAKGCPMGLTPHRFDASHADCLRCGACVQRCPVQALSLEAARKDAETTAYAA